MATELGTGQELETIRVDGPDEYGVVELTLAEADESRTPPMPAIAAESMNTDNLSLTRFCPRVAAAAGLSFMAVSRRARTGSVAGPPSRCR